MPSKLYSFQDLGEVVITKRKSSRHLRLRVKPDSSIHISIPYWSTYASALNFLNEKYSWVKKRQTEQYTIVLEENLRIGKYHKIKLLKTQATRPSTRVSENTLKIFIPEGNDIHSPQVIKITKIAITKLLKQQANQLLTQRLKDISMQTGYSYRNVSINSMKSRWGSCNNEKTISLNCYLMQLPWELIDYVIIHELVHTEVMRHGAPFWHEVEKHLPNHKELRKTLKKYHPSLNFA